MVFSLKKYLLLLIKLVLFILILRVLGAILNLLHLSLLSPKTYYDRIIFYAIVLLLLYFDIRDKISGFTSRWVSRETKLLAALIKDIEIVSQKQKEINEKASQIWGSLLRPAVTVPPLDAYRDWANATKDLVARAELCLNTYEKLSRKMGFRKKLCHAIWNFLAFPELWFNMPGIQRELRDQITKQESDVKSMCESLESSVSHVRRLRDRPIVQDTIYRRSKQSLSIEQTLDNLIAQNGYSIKMQYSIQLPLQLLLAFLEDLHGLRLETKSGEAWVNVAEQIIEELQRDMDMMIQNSAANGTGWFSNWKASNEFERLCARTETLISDLFKRKDLYGITFIRRYTSKSVDHRSPSLTSTADDMGILSLVDKITKQVELKPDRVCNKKLKDLGHRFKEVRKVVIEPAKDDEVMGQSRMTWKNKMKKIVVDTESVLRKYGTLPRIPNPKFVDEIKPFGRAVSLVEQSIKVCRIKLSEEINSVVGLEKDIDAVVPRLINDSKPLSTLSIVGMKGIGKTTLTKVIYEHRHIQKHFHEFKCWVSLPDTVANENDLLTLLGNQVMKTEEALNEKEYWIKKVSDFLKHKRYLVVLDNISRNEDWDSLKKALPVPEGRYGITILLTTRYKSVATHAASDSDQNSILHQLGLLTKEDSWHLFTQMVHFQSEPPSQFESQKIETLARKVVGRCGGLPISILHLGYLMSWKKVTSEDLTNLEHINHDQTAWSETLNINKRDLPLHLKHCLSYIGLFPRDYEIPRRRLVALWVAEGLAQESGNVQGRPESVAEKYLSELIDRNLIQVLERNLNGNIKTCGFPNALQELLSKVKSSVQRIAYYVDENGGRSTSSPNIWQQHRNLHSVLFFDTREGNKPGEDIGISLAMGIAKMHLLQVRVLDLEHVFRPQLPETIGKLTHLTYLGLRGTYLETIPSSIGNLVNLQTLDINYTYIRIVPSSIWKLQKLRHLYMNQTYRSKFEHHQMVGSLENLHTLHGAFVDKDSPLKDGIHNLTNLRKLALAFHFKLSQESFVGNLEKLSCLQTLKLRSIDEMGEPQDLHVKSLSNIGNLSRLYLFGKLLYPLIINDIRRLPESLIRLTLSASRLSVDPMPGLEKLQNLKWLSFYSDSYIGSRMVCSIGGFPNLLVLKFWMLKELKQWDVAEEAMPNLQHLEIRSCKNMKVPTGLKHLKKLQRLKLQEMPEEFTAEIEKTKDQIWGDIVISPSKIID